jgi:nucleoside phosphorylase
MAMPQTTPILVLAATDRELALPGDWIAVRCGVGPVEAAAATAAAIAAYRPAAIIHVGIAGARRAAGLVPPALVIGGVAHYCDLTVPPQFAPRSVTPDAQLLAAARRALPKAVVMAIGTSARVGGSSDCDVEAMEGFAVLRAAQLAGIPAIEVRAISNEIEDTDRARWQFEAAFAAIVAATPTLVAEAAACVR